MAHYQLNPHVRSAVAFATFVAVFCTGKPSNVEEGNRTAVLHIGNQTEPQDLDPHVITGIPEMNIITALLEGLVSEDPRDLSPQPGAAHRWKVSTDGLLWTFHLRPGGQWSNGDPLTAHDFVFSIRRILSPALGSEYAYMLYCIRNAEEYHRGAISDFSQVGVRALDSLSLSIELRSVTPYFLSLLTHTSWFPVHPPTVLKHGAIDQRGTQWTRPAHFVGNGPFTLARWETNRVIEVRKNERYWDAARVKLRAIRFYPIESDQTEERAFRSDQLHIAHTVPVNRLDWYRRNQPHLLHIDPYLGTYYYLLNVNHPPLNDVRVRRALAMSVDRVALVKSVTRAGEIPAYCFTPPNTAGYSARAAIPFDVEAARRLLSQAGYPGGQGFPTIELLYNTSELHHIVAQAVQEMWKKNLGITVTLTNQEWKVYLDAQTRKDYQISRAGWIGDYLDPNTFLDMWVTGGGNNRAGWSNPRYDSLIAAAARAVNQSERFAAFQQAEELLLSEAPIIPLYFYVSKQLIRPEVKGWYPNLLNHHPYKYVWLENN